MAALQPYFTQPPLIQREVMHGGQSSLSRGFDTNSGGAAARVHSAIFDLDLMSRGFDTKYGCAAAIFHSATFDPTRNDVLRPEFTQPGLRYKLWRRCRQSSLSHL